MVVSSDSEDEVTLDETTLVEGRRRGHSRITVEVNDRTKKVVSTFTDEEDQAIYKLKTDASVKNRVQQSIHLEDLDEQGAQKKLYQYLLKIGFGWFLQLGMVEVPLMFAEEFFTTFRFTATTDLDKPTISFRLLGLEFEMSVNEWAVRLGVVSICEITMSYWKKLDRGVPGKHITFDGKKEWKNVARKGAAEFSANRSLGADIEDPILRLAQIYIGFNVQGQGSCVTKVSLTELYFMRKIQRGEGVNLAFWLAYQAHQINRSKTRHLNLCHIVGVFIRNNMELIYARQGLKMELCMVPRPFNLSFLLEHKIVREFEGGYVFYEPGKVTPKPRNRANTLQGSESKEKAEDKYTLEWLVNEHLDLRTRIDVIFDRVTDMWNAMKTSRAGASSSKVVEEKVAEHEATEAKTGDPVEEGEADAGAAEDVPDDEGKESKDGSDHEEDKSVEEEEPAEGEDDAETAKLVQLAVQAVMESKRRAKEKKAEEKEAAGATPASRKKPTPVDTRKRKDPLQGSPDTRSLRSKRRK